MNIQELEDKHYTIWDFDRIASNEVEHTKLSVEFAIEQLENVIHNSEVYDSILNKIQELEKYLDENKL
jgi:hypothetical protein